MTCANWILTIIAVLILVFTFLPDLVGAAAVQWIMAILAIVILAVTWTGVKCKYCEKKSKKK
ncbi:MAG: hypothetical protein ABIF08_02280 [Nanoarchaeota archaeon]